MSTQPKENKEEHKEEELANVAGSDQDPDERYRIPSYQRRYNDRAASYCCESLKGQVEDGLDGTRLGYIQYDGWLKEFVIVHPSGHPVGCIKYCPWCGAHVGAGRELYRKKRLEYTRAGLIKTSSEFAKYWPIISEGLDQEETMRLIQVERLGEKEGAKPQGSY
jgi:hypothetical protein